MKERVLTIHGIATGGDWQEEITAAFSPHFECVSITYSQYRRLGILKLLLDPWVLGAGAALGSTIWWVAPAGGGAPSWIEGGFAALAMAAYLATYERRRRAFKTMLRQAGPYAQRAHQTYTHLIAHSFGTYLAGRALAGRPDFHLGRIVFVGSVLPRSFPWNRMRGVPGTSDKFLEVRNELGGADYVVWIAWAASALIRGLGLAGLRGFATSDLVHTVGDPRARCAQCHERPAPIHNVLSADLGHSDTFVNSGYAEWFWLPFLWGIEPHEYHDFVKLCTAAAALEREWSEQTRTSNHVDQRLATIEDELHRRQWRWTQGTFGSYVAREVMSRFPGTPDTLKDSVALAVRGTWLAVMQALEAQQARADRLRKREAPDTAQDASIAWLNPHLAVRKAVASLA
jgi:hypothetical protein